MTKFFLSILLLAVSAFGATFTSTQAGAFEDAATWGGGGVPGDGDTITVQHTVTVSDARTVGHSPNSVYHTTPAIRINSNSSTLLGNLSLQPGATLTVRGDVKMTSPASNYARASTLEVPCGATFRFDSSQVANPDFISYRLYEDTSNSYSKIYFGQDCTSGRATFTSVTTNSAAYGILHDRITAFSDIRIANTDISKCGYMRVYTASTAAEPTTPAITSISQVSNVVTVTLDGPHHLNGSRRPYVFQKANPALLAAGDYAPTIINSTQFSYTLSGNNGEVMLPESIVTISDGCIEMQLAGDGTTDRFIMSHSTMDDTNGITPRFASESTHGAGDVISFTNNTITNPMVHPTHPGSMRLRGSISFIGSGQPTGSGVRLISENYIELPSQMNSTYYAGFTVTNNIFRGNFNNNISDGTGAAEANKMASFDGNVHIKDTPYNASQLAGDVTNSYLIQTVGSSGGQGNPHGWKLNLNANTLAEGNLFEFIGGQNNPSDPNMLIQPVCPGGTSCSYTYTIRKNIFLPASYYTYDLDVDPENFGSDTGDYTGVRTSSVITNSIGSSPYLPTMIYEHNTGSIHGTACCTGSPYFGEGGVQRVGAIDVFKSNIQWASTPGLTYGWQSDAERRTTLLADSLTPGGTTNNACGNCKTVPGGTWTATGKTGANGTVYDTPWSVAGGANDLPTTEMPQFLDAKRSFRKWADVRQGLEHGSSTLDSAVTYLRGGSTLSERILDLINWVKEGFTPTNEAYRGTAHDGGDIGAMAMAVEGEEPDTPPTPIQWRMHGPPLKKEFRLHYIAIDNGVSTTLLDAAVAEAKRVKANGVIFEVRRDGYLLYRNGTLGDATHSSVTVGYDPTRYLIDKVHSEGLQFHAWFHVSPLGYVCHTNQPSNHVWKLHGQSAVGSQRWQTVSTSGAQGGKPENDCSGSVTYNGFADAGKPEFARYITNIIAAFHAAYPDVDGIQLDYNRLPDQYSPTNRFGYHPESISRFQAATSTSGTVTEATTGWHDWRVKQWSDIVVEVYMRAKKQNPKVLISASVRSSSPVPIGEDFCNSTTMAWGACLSEKQDWHSWLQGGYLDLAALMLYRKVAADADFNGWVAWLKNHKHGNKAQIILGGYDNDVPYTMSQRRRIEQGYDGYAMFRYRAAADPSSDSSKYYDQEAGFAPFKAKVPSALPPQGMGWIAGRVTSASNGDYYTVQVRDSSGVTVLQTRYSSATGFWGLPIAAGSYHVRVIKNGSTVYQTPSVVTVLGRRVKMVDASVP